MDLEPKDLIKLYLAKNIEQLEELSKRDIRQFKEDRLFNSAEKVFSSGLNKYTAGDQETAFIYFTRFRVIVDKLKIKHADVVQKRLGAEINTTEGLIIKLRSNLEKRYYELNVNTKTNLESGDTQNGNTLENREQGLKIKEESLLKKLPQFNDGFIGPVELYALISSKTNLVIFDTRSIKDYEGSNMRFDFSVNIPEDHIRSGLSANMLGYLLPEKSKGIYEKRYNSNYIVLIDWNLDRTNTTINNKTVILKDIITNWDTHFNENMQVVFLEGGYLAWWENYPMYCTNAYQMHQQTNAILEELIDLDVVEYPLAAGIQQEEEQPPQIPEINRSLKPVEPKKYQPERSAILKAKWEEYLQDLNDLKQKRIEELQEMRRDLVKPSRSPSPVQDIRIDQHLPPAETITKPYEFHEQKDIVRHKLEEEARKLKPKFGKREGSPSRPSVVPPGHREPPKRPMKRVIPSHSSTTDLPLDVTQVDFIKSKDLKKLLQRDEVIERRTDVFSLPPADPNRSMKRGRVPGVTGLKNLVNTCFMNSVLQALSNTPLVAQYFIAGEHIVDLSNKALICPRNLDSESFAVALAETVVALWTPNGPDAYFPRKMKYVAFKWVTEFHEGHHEDAHEFFIKTLNMMHEELQQDLNPKRFIVYTPQQKAWVEQNLGKVSIVNDIFMGQIRGRMLCNNCLNSHDTFETFYSIDLNLPHTKECNLSDCLNKYLAPRKLDEYMCRRCKERNFVNQHMSISTFPPVLVFCALRFKNVQSNNGSYIKKNHIAVKYPHKITLKNIEYQLYAAVMHFGEMSGGHYISYCENPVNKRWYKFNDEKVTEVECSQAVAPKDAYILYYKMIE